MKEIEPGISPTTPFYIHTLSAPLGLCSLSHNWHFSPWQEHYLFFSSPQATFPARYVSVSPLLLLFH